MILLRILILVLILVALAVAVVPVMVLINLLSDGTGFGMCPGGLSACPLRYTSGPALAAYLTLTLMVVVGLIRVVSHLLRRLNRHAGAGQAVSDRSGGRHSSGANGS